MAYSNKHNVRRKRTHAERKQQKRRQTCYRNTIRNAYIKEMQAKKEADALKKMEADALKLK